jgi:hypothetical protein
MRVYISGPIAGREDGNRAAFGAVASWLRAEGHEPVNPHEVDHDHPGSPCFGKSTGRPDVHRYGCYLLADIKAIRGCDAVARLWDWNLSPGARAEVAFAEAIGLDFMDPPVG